MKHPFWQVPTEFSFVDVDPKHGLTEAMVPHALDDHVHTTRHVSSTDRSMIEPGIMPNKLQLRGPVAPNICIGCSNRSGGEGKVQVSQYFCLRGMLKASRCPGSFVRSRGGVWHCPKTVCG